MSDFDYEIDGVGYYSAASNQFPHTRKTGDWRSQQIDTSSEPGEQSLNGWWRRAQSSFHLGTGITFMDPGRDPQLSYQFHDSHGINPWTEGQVSLLRKSSLVRGSTNGNLHAVGYAIAGQNNGGGDVPTAAQNGVLFADSTQVWMVPENGTGATPVNWGGASTILDMTTDGGSYFIVAVDGVYRGPLPGNGVSGTRIYAGTFTRAKIAFAKDRLMACLDKSIYELPTTPDTANTPLPPALWTNPASGWIWSAISDGPNGVYFAGYAGDHSLLYMTTLDNSNGTAPQLLVPFTIAEMDRGEIATSLYTYAGNIVVVGTSLGFRFASIQNDGSLTLGSLTETDGVVYAANGRGNHVWIGGASSNGKTALYRADLSRNLALINNGQAVYLMGSQFGSLVFPHAHDLFLDSSVYTGQPIRSVVQIGLTGRVAYTIDGVGLVFEAASELVDSGWLQTGRIRYDMSDPKIIAYGRVISSTQAGHLNVAWINEAGTSTSAADYDTSGVSEADFEIDLRTPHKFVSLRFTLTRSSTNNTVGPLLSEYVVKALPSVVKQRMIQLALMCYHTEKGTGRPVIRPTMPRIEQLEALDESSAVFPYKNNGTGEHRMAVMDSVQFAQTFIPEGVKQKAYPEGVLIVTLRLV